MLSRPKFEALEDVTVAFSGYGMKPFVNGQETPAFSSFSLKCGDRLTFKPMGKGKTAYLALAGGIESARFMGSASTDLKGKLGLALAEGDMLGQAWPKIVLAGRSFQPYHLLSRVQILRVEANPERLDLAKALCQQSFDIGEADRMGVRLQGEPLAGGETISEATMLGAVQVPPSGLPLILLHDRGTLGGYQRAATLIPEDLPKAAQLHPGMKVKFKLYKT
ncbi:MAG: biotin-dependent carboxyltransferase family protein [Deinococcales bacterium]